MTRMRLAGAGAFAAAVVAGTISDVTVKAVPGGTTVLVGDFHVHGMPGDGALPVWEIQREAGRRGLDVVAITNHNDNSSLRLANGLGLVKAYPIVIPGEELTTRDFHMAAVGVTTMIDPRLPARDAIAAIHAQGGVAIAAHPVATEWRVEDPEALKALDGAEVAHPIILGGSKWDVQLREFFQRTRAVNPDIAPIGSTDYHMAMPLGLCRTYLIVDEISREGVLDAIRRGRTVASGPGDRLVGADEHVNAVKAHLKPPQPSNFGRGTSTWLAFVALLSLGLVVASD
jgi:hypothetical protein